MREASWTPDVFNALYRSDPDPWGFTHRPYEQAKLAHWLSLLPAAPIRFGVELGCAIGVGTAALATRCERVLAIDASTTALAAARLRCAAFSHVEFAEAFLPAGYPAEAAMGCDLVVISELLYFLSPHDVVTLAGRIAESVVVGGSILIVNWTGATDTPQTGDEAANCFLAAGAGRGLALQCQARRDSYRIDIFRRT